MGRPCKHYTRAFAKACSAKISRFQTSPHNTTSSYGDLSYESCLHNVQSARSKIKVPPGWLCVDRAATGGRARHTDENVKEFERVEALLERARIIVDTEASTKEELCLPRFMHFLKIVDVVRPRYR